MNEALTGILLMNYGAPLGMDDVAPFLQEIFAGRKLLPGVVTRAQARYQVIGGGSPLLATTRQQAGELEKELNRDGERFRVFSAMLHSPPFALEALAEAGAAGINRVVVLSLAPFFSRTSTAAYFAAAEEAWTSGGYTFQLDFAGDWHLNHWFLQAVAREISHSLEKKEAGWPCKIIFTAHSIPQGEDASSYQSQIFQSAEAIMAGFPGKDWQIAFQSKGGGPLPWLGPELGQVLEDLAFAGGKGVLVVPMGFVSDNLETLYDLDVEGAEKARQMGLDFIRCPALNRSPLLIKALADTVLDQLRNEMIL